MTSQIATSFYSHLFQILIGICILWSDPVLAQETIRFQWNIIPSQSMVSPKFISGTGISSFTVVDQSLRIFEHTMGKWNSISIPHPAEHRLIDVISLRREEYLALVVDNMYRTHLFAYVNGRWTKDDFIAPSPLKKIIPVPGIGMVAYGDDGQLLIHEQNQWKQIRTSIKNHITSLLVASPDTIFIGTRAEGIFQLDTSFRDRHLPADVKGLFDVKEIKTYRSRHYALLSNGLTVVYSDGEFHTTDPPPDLWDATVSAGIGFQSGRGSIPAGDFTFIFPSRWRVTDYILFPDTTALLLSEDGTLRAGRLTEKNYFVDVSDEYEIRSFSHIVPKGIAAADVDNDGAQDLFLFHVDEQGRNILLRNSGTGPFIDVTTEMDIPSRKNFELFAFGDIDGDGRQDLAFLESTGAGKTIVMYKNTGRSFHSHSEIPAETINNDKTAASLVLPDVDGDGNRDVGAAFYYSRELEKGYVSLHRNHRWGSFRSADGTVAEMTAGWANSILFADVDTNGYADIIVTNRWMNPVLLMNSGAGFTAEHKKRFPDRVLYNSFFTEAIDCDVDGDVDLFVVSDSAGIIRLNNDGAGYFTVDSSVDFSRWRKSGLPRMVFADFNNDGRPDMLVYGLPAIGKNILLLQTDKGMFEEDRIFATEFPSFDKVITLDVDNDGDIDLFARSGLDNLLLVNTVNGPNSITVYEPHDISTPHLFGATVRLYSEGHAGNPAHLRGSGMFGTSNNEPNFFNDGRLHFGIPEGTYDIEVVFPGGVRRIYSGIPNGAIVAADYPASASSLFRAAAGSVYRQFRDREFTAYLLLVIVSLLVIIAGVRLGVRRYRWDVKLTVGLAVIDLTLFWVLVLLTRESPAAIKFGIPLLVNIGGIVVPLIVFAWIHSRIPQRIPLETVRKDLLSVMLGFQHGEWAMRNLNGMIILCQNVPENFYESDRYRRQFTERKETFMTSTLPAVRNVYSLISGDPLFHDNAPLLETALSSAVEALKLTEQHQQRSVASTLRGVAAACNDIKSILASIQNKIYAEFSSDAVTIVRQVTEGLRPQLIENGIGVSIVNEANNQSIVVMAPHDLTDVIDNVLSNAVHSLTGRSVRSITITVTRFGNRVKIFIADTGIGIDPGQREKVFEQGVSGRGSTGTGLPSCRTIVSRYGGKIAVADSAVGQGTTIVIDLIGVS
ncbi:MAG: FG-GAP-like repeat-containing protein [Bacteroidota bacterium]